MAYNIEANTTKLTDLVSEIRTKREKLESEITNIYNAINNMHDYWYGESYATFSSECYSYASSLQAMVTMVEAFAVLFDGEVMTNATEFIDASEKAFENIG